MQKKPIEPDSHYEERRITPRWKRGELPAAGLYLLDDAYHVAVPGTPAEQRLLEAGALTVAGIRFDGQGVDAQPRGDLDVVALYVSERDQLGTGRTVAALGGAPARN